MNFEKWMKKRGNNKLNAYAKNPYHVSWFKRVPMWGKIAVPALVAVTAAVVVISVGVLPNFFALGNKAARPAESNANSYSQRTSQQNSSKSAPAYSSHDITPADPKDLSSDYPSFMYNGTLYHVAPRDVRANEAATIDSSNLEEKATDLSIPLEKDGSNIVNASIYPIADISSDFAIAVKFTHSTGYYVYLRDNYSKNTLGDLVNDLSIKEVTTIASFEFTNYTSKLDINGYSKDSVYNILFADVTLEKQTTLPNNYNFRYRVLATHPSIENAKIDIQIREDNYLTIGFLNETWIYHSTSNNIYENIASYVNSLA